MPFARIDLIQGKAPEYRAAVADIVYRGIVDVLKAPDGDRFIVVSEHTADNLIYDPKFLGFNRSADFLLIQVTSTVGNTPEQKRAFFRQVADDLNRRVGIRREDVFINLVFVERADWSFGMGSLGERRRRSGRCPEPRQEPWLLDLIWRRALDVGGWHHSVAVFALRLVGSATGWLGNVAISVH